MSDLRSYQAHNAEYESYDLDHCRRTYEDMLKKGFTYNDDNPLGQNLGRIREEGLTMDGVDIGSGHGLYSHLMAQDLERVFSIEPSTAAHTFAKSIWSSDSNISWINAFASEGLLSLSLDKPTLFVSLTVLSHLDDGTVIAICNAMNSIAPKGSRLSFNENWGAGVQENLWYSRSKEWWELRFPNWSLTFHPIKGNRNGMFKSFSGTYNHV